jgi:hypothetical protein
MLIGVSLESSRSVRSTASEIVSQCRITEVACALTGVEPRRTGPETARMPAIWRGGDGLNVSLDDRQGVWHDFAADEGGGVLDLIVRVRGGSRADALRWAAEFAGVPIKDTPLSRQERARWAAELREIERDLPIARYWRRAAINLAGDLLATLKAALFDRTLPQPEIGELRRLEALLASLQRSDGAALNKQYRWWRQNYPGMTAAMIRAARARERAECRALLAYLGLTDPRRRAE